MTPTSHAGDDRLAVQSTRTSCRSGKPRNSVRNTMGEKPGRLGGGKKYIIERTFGHNSVNLSSWSRGAFNKNSG